MRAGLLFLVPTLLAAQSAPKSSVPRMTDGKPDFTGVWQGASTQRGRGFLGRMCRDAGQPARQALAGRGGITAARQMHAIGAGCQHRRDVVMRHDGRTITPAESDQFGEQRTALF